MVLQREWVEFWAIFHLSVVLLRSSAAHQGSVLDFLAAYYLRSSRHGHVEYFTVLDQMMPSLLPLSLHEILIEHETSAVGDRLSAQNAAHKWRLLRHQLVGCGEALMWSSTAHHGGVLDSLKTLDLLKLLIGVDFL